MEKTKNKPANGPRQKPRRGRPTHYCVEVAERICALLAEGQTLNAARKILAKEVPNFPARPTLLAWANDPAHPFSEMYARARMIGYQIMADDLIDIADALGTSRKGARDPSIVQRDRLRVETRKWVMAKALPRIYGDRSEVNVTASKAHHLDSVTIEETRRFLESQHDPAIIAEGQGTPLD